MSAVRDFILLHPEAWLAGGGLMVGLAFGALVARTHFCTMGAFSDIHNLGDWRRFRSWMLAIAVAIAGTHALALLGIVDLARSMYLAPRLNWSGHLLGGAMFGFGMVFAGGCASRNLARIGGGDLRALMTVIVIGLTAFVTMGGVLGPLRAALEAATALTLPAPTQSLGDVAGSIFGWKADPLQRVLALAAAAGLTVACFANADFRASPVHVLAGAGVGLCVVAGWAVTGLASDDLAARPVALGSLTYVRPSGDALEWLQRFTAGPWPGFGVASVFGAIGGAFLVSCAQGRLKLTTFADVRDAKWCLMGAVLMGIGGVLALGCTVGQGITGLSTLALGSVLTFGAIAAGSLLGLRIMERWLMADG